MPIEKFPYTNEHPNFEAHKWIDALLENGPTPDPFGLCKPQVEKAAALEKNLQISVLRACVERMPWYRARNQRIEGAVCYAVACCLYNRKLPLQESDICELLMISQHSCGHGGDVVEPFDFMLSYAREKSISPAILRATRTHVEKLTGVMSIRAQHIKTMSALVLLLDGESEERPNHCWSERFRLEFRDIVLPERRHWELFVLDVKPTLLSEMPTSTRKKLEKFLKGVGEELVVKRLSGWFPDPSKKALFPIDTGGSHLLKHFVWVLEVASEDPKLQPEVDALICRLSNLDWKPRDKGQKVMVTAAHYLAKRPPEVSWEALQKIENWCRSVPKSDYTGSKLDALIRNYQQRHGCVAGKS